MFTLKETFSNLNLYLTSKVLMGGGHVGEGATTRGSELEIHSNSFP